MNGAGSAVLQLALDTLASRARLNEALASGVGVEEAQRQLKHYEDYAAELFRD